MTIALNNLILDAMLQIARGKLDFISTVYHTFKNSVLQTPTSGYLHIQTNKFRAS